MFFLQSWVIYAWHTTEADFSYLLLQFLLLFQKTKDKTLPTFRRLFQYRLESLGDDTMLKQLPMMADIADVALFLASDLAGKITGVTIDVTAGTTNGLNYKIPVIPFV